MEIDVDAAARSGAGEDEEAGGGDGDVDQGELGLAGKDEEVGVLDAREGAAKGEVAEERDPRGPRHGGGVVTRSIRALRLAGSVSRRELR